MKVFTRTDKTILGKHCPKNICIDVPEAKARFLIDKEGFEAFKEVQHKNKDIKEGGKK